MSVKQFALTALSPLDGRYRSQLTETAEVFSEFSLIKYRLLVEVHYLVFLSDQKFIPAISATERRQLLKLVSDFDPAQAEIVKTFEQQTKHDVKAVEYFLRQKLQQRESPLESFVHLGLTSEDVNSMAYGLQLQLAQTKILQPQLDTLLQQIIRMAAQYRTIPMLARTHGQPAVPTTVGKELINFGMRLWSELKIFKQIKIKAKLTGAVGNFNAQMVALSSTDSDWLDLSQKFVSSLGLEPELFTIQTVPPESYTQLFGSLVRIHGILLDLNQDLWRYISDGYFIQQLEKGQIGSSTMPHKVNPIDFENSEGNLGLANALLVHFMLKLPVSRLQRDLSDSTVRRSFGTALGYANLAYASLIKGLKKISINETKLHQELDQHWEVLAEAFQVVLRMNGDTQGYEKLQKLSQGHTVTQSELQTFINSLQLPVKVKKQLSALTPFNYLGLAPQLTERGLKCITKYLEGDL